MNLSRLSRDPAAFIDTHIKVNELGKPFELQPYQRDLFSSAFWFDEDGKLCYDTFLWSCPKKSGKTAMAAALTTWWAYTQEAPNELYIVANDLEQAQGRAWKAAAQMIQRNPTLARSADITTNRIRLSNGTDIVALPNDYRGSAGSNHGFTAWDEVWAYTSENARRLWDELTPVPTRKNSIRLVTTYAGFEAESDLLWELYRDGVGTDEYRDGKGTRILEHLPVYENGTLWTYWDHEARLPWQTPAYYASQRKTLRPNAYIRLHENRWTTASSIFLTPELWDPCVDIEHRPELPNKRTRVFVGVDASTKHDSAAIAAVRWARDRKTLELVHHRIWKPTPESPLDIEETLEAEIDRLHKGFVVSQVLVDPYQMHRSIATLRKRGVPVFEFPQTTASTVQMGQAIFDLVKGQNIRLYPDDELRTQALSTVAVENPRGWRIAKEKASRKIDAIVALSMACVAAMDAGPGRDPNAMPVFFGHSGGDLTPWARKH
jgi:phage terminase large subunit-like protein